jgi:hypothetical protein
MLIERIAGSDRSIDYLTSAALALSVIVAFVINRSLGMPQATDDIGNWLEPLGFLSLVIEANLLYQSWRGFHLVRRANGSITKANAKIVQPMGQGQDLAA